MTWFQPSLRWRLAAISALLTFGILLVFALAVGQLTTARIKSDFDNALAADVNRFLDQSQVSNLDASSGTFDAVTPDVDSFGDAMIRVLDSNGVFIKGSKDAPNFPVSLNDESTRIGAYRVETRQRAVPTVDDRQVAINIIVQYARKTSDVDATIAEVRLFLAFGVLAGTILSLVAGLVLAHRAMKPIGRLTATAREIARTRDPNQAIPVPDSDDEVAELAQTLDEMLKAGATAAVRRRCVP
jgi:two-component system OmpR family sensor kinase